MNNKEQMLKGSIYFNTSTDGKKKRLLHYQFIFSKSSIHQSLLNAFKNFKFSSSQKKILTRSHRQYLNNYQNINIFELKRFANELCESINTLPKKEINLYSSEFGVWVCLAAIYSGKIEQTRQVNFYFENAPIGLFPKPLMKQKELKNTRILFSMHKDYWPNQFKSCIKNKFIPIKHLKVS